MPAGVLLETNRLTIKPNLPENIQNKPAEQLKNKAEIECPAKRSVGA
jgi:hypothetical protein